MFDGPRALAAETLTIGRGHAERIAGAVRERLDEAGTDVSGISGIAVVAGPGSFTGLRAGLAFARGLALGLGVPATGVSRMRALAHGRGPVRVVLDARREAVFHQAFAAGGEPVSDLALTPVDVFRGGPEPLAGSGASLVAGDRGVLFDHDAPPPQAIAAVARIAPLPARPIYGRGADAKVQRPPLSA